MFKDKTNDIMLIVMSSIILTILLITEAMHQKFVWMIVATCWLWIPLILCTITIVCINRDDIDENKENL